MARPRTPHVTASEGVQGDLAAEHARLLLEVQRLTLVCTGLRHDHATVARERDGLLKENIALRKGEQNREREAALRRREVACDRREATRNPDALELLQKLVSRERDLRFAQHRISSLELWCQFLEMQLRDAKQAASHPGATVPKHEIARQLRDLLQLCHPDKWQNAAVATELTKHVNALRAAYME